MEEKNNISLIILVSLILFSIKWIYSFTFFPDEEITLRVISESLSDSYFHYVKVLSELNFSNEYSVNKNKFLLITPIGSIVFHSILYKIIGIYSFIILELVFIFLFIFLFSSIFIRFDLNSNISLLLAIFIFSLPIIINLINLDITLLNNFGSIFYNLKFPRPLVTNIYLFYFLYFMVMIHNKELFTIKNIYILGIFFALVLSSSFFIFLPLCIYLLIFVLKKNTIKNIIKKIKKIKKHFLFSFLIFLIIGFIFLYLTLNSNPDYLSRMGIIKIDSKDKFFLLEFYFDKLVMGNTIILIIIPILSFFLIKKYLINKYTYIVDIFFLSYICSLISPFILILISNKIAFLNHINNFIIVNLFLYFFIISISVYKIFLDKFNFNEPKTFIVNSSIIILIVLNIFNTDFLSNKNKIESKFRTDKNNVIKKIKNINKNCSIITFDNSIMTYLILKEFKNLHYLNGTFADRDDKILENNLINSLKILNITYEDFKKLMQSDWDGWRLKNSNMQQLFWQKYQANSFYTYKNSKDFKENEIEIINNTSPSTVHQFVIPIFEKERLLNKFKKNKINNMPDFIVINKNHKFWSNEKINKNTFNIFLENENFKVYFKSILSVKCR